MTARDEAQEIVGLFRSLRHHLIRVSRAELARSGLTAAQLSVISLLGNRGAMTMGELSHELEVSHSTVSGIVDRLEAKDVVRRAPDPKDRRYIRISLAERIARRHPAPQGDGPTDRLEAALAAGTSEERQRIKEGLELLLRFVGALGDDG